jgi:hypothetical protein
LQRLFLLQHLKSWQEQSHQHAIAPDAGKVLA